MNAELRPRTLGEILDGTAQLYRSHFLLFVGIAVFPRALQLVWGLIQVSLVRGLDAHHVPSTAFTIGASVFSVLLYIVSAGVGTAATNRAVSAIYLGQATSIGQAYREVKARWVRYVSVLLVSLLYAWGPTLVPYAAIFTMIGLNAKKIAAMGAPGGGAASAGVITAGIVMGIAVLVLLVTVPFGVWMTTRYAVAIPASIFEGIGVRASLKRSVFLTLKGRGRIFVMMLMVTIIFYIVVLAADMPEIIGIMKAAKNHQQPPLMTLIYANFANFVVYSIIGPIYAIAITLFYYDERIRKEGFDIEWMMERANLGVGPPPVPTIEAGADSDGAFAGGMDAGQS